MDDKNQTPLASEMYADLKETNLFLRKLLIGALAVIAILVAALVGTNIYHIYQWSQIDTYYIDGGDGGNANYIGGDNTGGIYNGEGGSPTQEENQ